MTEPKFTPGLWHTEINWKPYVAQGNGIVLAEVWNNSVISRNEAEANAALIAAAPEMYNMLQSVLDECAICDPNFHYPGDCDLRGQIEAVLKKARGEA